MIPEEEVANFLNVGQLHDLDSTPYAEEVDFCFRLIFSWWIEIN
jgi:hypothetical protein